MSECARAEWKIADLEREIAARDALLVELFDFTRRLTTHPLQDAYLQELQTKWRLLRLGGA